MENVICLMDTCEPRFLLPGDKNDIANRSNEHASDVNERGNAMRENDKEIIDDDHVSRAGSFRDNNNNYN